MSKIKVNVKSKRLWLIAGVIIVAIFFGTRLSDRDVVFTYTYDEVAENDVVKTVSVSGSLDLFEREIVRSEIGGEISEIHTDYNEKVKEGDLLLEIYSEEIVEAYDKFSDTYRFKLVDLENARDIYRTKKQLFDEELISEREYSDALVSYQRMQSSYKEIKKEYERKKELLDSRMVYSPVDGVIIDKGVELNQTIASNTVLFEIAPTLEKMKLLINIDESDIGIVKKGQKVSFQVSAYPDDVFDGTIQEIRMSPVDVNGITMYKSMVLCNNKDEKLKPGMSATATIHIGQRENVLSVSNQAFVVVPPELPDDLEDDETKQYVWVKKAALVPNEIPVKRVEVEIGLRGDSYTEIVSGDINESDEVLISVFEEKK